MQVYTTAQTISSVRNPGSNMSIQWRGRVPQNASPRNFPKLIFVLCALFAPRHLTFDREIPSKLLAEGLKFESAKKKKQNDYNSASVVVIFRKNRG